MAFTELEQLDAELSAGKSCVREFTDVKNV